MNQINNNMYPASRVLPDFRQICNPYVCSSEIPVYYCFKQKCRSGKQCEGTQKHLQYGDIGTTPPSYEVSSVSTETIECADCKDPTVDINNSVRVEMKNKSTRYKNKAFDKSNMAHNKTRFKNIQLNADGDKLHRKTFNAIQYSIDGQCREQPCCNCKPKTISLSDKIKRKSPSFSSSFWMRTKSNKTHTPRIHKNMVKIEIKPKGKQLKRVKDDDTDIFCQDGLCTDTEMCSEPLRCLCKDRQIEIDNTPILRAKKGSIIKPQKRNLSFSPMFKNISQKTPEDCNKNTTMLKVIEPDSSNGKYCKGGLCTDSFKCSNSVTCKCYDNKTKHLKKNKNYCECKNDFQNILNMATLNDTICEKGLCVTAKKNKIESFICNCSSKAPIQCSDDTCNAAKHSISTRTLIKIKNKGSVILNKFSDMLTNKSVEPASDIDVCQRGICKDTKNRTKDFLCKCVRKPQISECSDDTCNTKKRKYAVKSTKVMASNMNNNTETTNSFLDVKEKITKFYNCLSSNLSSLLPKSVTIDKRMKILQNQSEQTGEPFFELKIDPLNMCILNSEEIKQNVDKFEKSRYCICPSHKTEKSIYLQKIYCPEGACKQAVKNKSTNFTCNCKKIRGECSDATCAIANPLKPIINTRPLFDVELDRGTMCVVNSDEIRKMFNNIKKYRDAPNECASGVCQGAITKKQSIACKCVRRFFEANECHGETCKVDKNTNDIKMTSRTRPIQNNNNKDSNRLCVICNINSVKSLLSKFHFMKNTQQIKRLNYISKNKKGKIRKRNGLSLPLYSKTDNIPNVISELPKKRSTKLKGRHKRKTLSLPIGSFRTTSKMNGNIKTKDNDKTSTIIPKIKLKLPINKKEDTPYAQVHRNMKTSNKKQNEKEIVISHKSRNGKNSSGKIHKRNTVCMCNHICACLSKKKKKKKKRKPKKVKRKKTKRKNNDEDKQKAKEKLAEEREFRKETIRELKIQRKKKKKEMKRQKKELEELMRGKEETEERSCLADCTLGILTLIGISIRETLRITFSLIFRPKKSYFYIVQRLKDPFETYERIKRFFWEYWQVKKLSMMKTTGGSETMSVVIDTFQNSAIYDAFADKGKTTKERQIYKNKMKKRKNRIKKRKNQALFGCRHMLLTTLRKTPCLWVYHICPNCYPQFLSLRVFLRNFLQLLIIIFAVVVWTPCILCCELCRGFLCCFVCTQ